MRSLTGTWRGIAPVYGALLVAVMAAWWLMAREAHSSSDRTGEAPTRLPGRQVLRRLLGIGNVRTVLMLSVGTFLLNHGLGAWLPTVLQEGGMSLSQAGRWAAAGDGGRRGRVADDAAAGAQSRPGDGPGRAVRR